LGPADPHYPPGGRTHGENRVFDPLPPDRSQRNITAMTARPWAGANASAAATGFEHRSTVARLQNRPSVATTA